MTRQLTEKQMDAIRQRFQGRHWSAYGIAILVAINDAQPEDTHQIEQVMRDRFSTLDHLYFDELSREAKHAWRAVKQLRKEGIFDTPSYRT